MGAARSGVHCEPRGVVSRTPVSPTNGRMSIRTKFCIGTVPSFCTLSSYSTLPPIRVPAEEPVKPPSQTPSTCLLEIKWAMGATLIVPVELHSVSAVLASPSKSSASVCEPPEQRWLRPGASLSRLNVLESGPAGAPGAGEVRDLLEILRRRQAGRPVVERPAGEDEVDRQQVGRHQAFQGHR